MARGEIQIFGFGHGEKLFSRCPICNEPVQLKVASVGTLSGRTFFEGYCKRCFEIVSVDSAPRQTLGGRVHGSIKDSRLCELALS